MNLGMSVEDMRAYVANSKIVTRNAADILRSHSEFFREKNIEHGNSYKDVGEMLNLMFPNGLTLKGTDDFNIFSVFITMLYKIKRISGCMFSDSHLKYESATDSPKDLSIYSAMLQELMEAKIDSSRS